MKWLRPNRIYMLWCFWPPEISLHIAFYDDSSYESVFVGFVFHAQEWCLR